MAAKKTLMKKNFSKTGCGLIFSVISCALFWLPYPYKERHFLFSTIKHLSLHPTLVTGTAALAFTACLYVRGIFRLKKSKFMFIQFLINLTLFATLFEIFISPGKETATSVSRWAAAFFAFTAATVLFGVREIAKTVFLLFFLLVMFLRLKLVSDAMGIFGYAAFLCMLAGFYLQGSINVRKMRDEWLYLTGRENQIKLENPKIEKLP
ncbi:hypothetical protein [Treponema parvum]|uniref:hypothetical protein n=1 Tax=Treponema parvum TaxID=138851 RepID=UPI001AEBF47D|nr:hypothetical protein [Treponema parvum]QTQ15638.1 hypothetical protein HXT04_02370 [Treponema parvum]